ncbi:fluoroquinolone transport system ATP-binding protein [Planifilum fimeticola]|jgi:fluoroquinolone transport system ATP-binding protein|uniref:Fluoroquinolone transport system ATP-binding protein n=1 Tax=Planifilum fimeticola TaxID=201975 RepID=A0A2T0LIY0_9BACL|nr:ABC transporter ATP-binding protein [Planifilum fimeticola]PRX42295.1 fluoroquinolone transport system ATP-binding protein [Planifilum fimeticola]
MIEVHDLHYRYPGSREAALRGVSFHIKKGEIFGFLGPSGAGKSTLQRILIGLLPDYAGTARVNGVEAKEAGPDFYERIGVAFEFPNFYSRFTALENLSFFSSLYTVETEDPRNLLTKVGLESHSHTRISRFSKGMKTRLNLCRALLNRPLLLFLDEPTSGLDPVNTRIVKEWIREKKAEGTTILITTHNMHVAEELCDRVAFIVNGRIRLIDSPNRLKRIKGRRKIRVEYREGEKLRAIDFDLNGIGANAAFLRLLREREIEAIHTRDVSLEQIFLEITGSVPS